MESLSTQTEPYKLQDVAKKLLGLQTMINSSFNSAGNNLLNQSKRPEKSSNIKNIFNIMSNNSTMQSLDLTQETRLSSSFSPKNKKIIKQPKHIQMNSYSIMNPNSFRTISTSPFR